MQSDSPPRFRVLIVDDEVVLGKNLCAYLETQEFTTVYANQLDMALNFLEHDLDLDLVITDIYLGSDTEKAGGHIICDAAARRSPPLPAILLTGKPTMDAALEGLRADAADFLTKPVNLGLLHKRALQAIESRKLKLELMELTEVNRVLSGILPKAIEAKDPTTGGHSDRVVSYADNLARRMGVCGEDRKDLRLASQLHDVGKIGIPESILCKEGPLTRDERTIIEEHPEIGHRILEPLVHLPRVRQWVFEHHERWDGKGYPQGLTGDQVALPGRILILAEVFDALATARSYKKAWSRDKIADFFIEEAGHHFDPDLSHIVGEGVRAHGADFFRQEIPSPEGGGTATQAQLF